MSQWLRILLPVGLGAAAFTLNAWTMSRAMTPNSYVMVNTDIKGGEVFESRMFAPIELSGDVERLNEVLIRWDEKSLLAKLPAPRAMQPGDVVFKRDLVSDEEPGDSEAIITLDVSRAHGFEPSLLNPGDRVSLLFQSRGDDSGTWLEGYRVLAVGPRTWKHTSGEKHSRVQTLSVAVTRDGPQHDNLVRMMAGSSVQSVTF
ncbi:MAG: hypothetical protein KDA52_02390 [Planctomycetaceae bacterium]|nr:hypothetical protein [Planctomycetaceae bacterium]